MKPPRFAKFAAMTSPVFLCKTPCLGGRTELFLDPAVSPDDDVTALGHAEGLFEPSKMIKFGAGRMFERLKP